MCPRPTPGPKSKGGSTLNNMRSLLYWDGELYDGCFLFSTIERACPELVADLLCSHQPLWRNNGRSTKTQRNLLWPRALRSRATIHNLCAHLVDEGIGAAWPHPASGNLLTQQYEHPTREHLSVYLSALTPSMTLSVAHVTGSGQRGESHAFPS